MAVLRAEYRNPDGTVRASPSTVSSVRGDVLVDVEGYALPMAKAFARDLLGPGVHDGLRVSATIGSADVTVSPGTAHDGTGNQIVLVSDGFAVIDPSVPPNQVQNVPTVVVGATGVVLPSAGLTGDVTVVISWREVAGPTGTYVRRHAPWVRLLAAGAGSVSALDLPLAVVTLDSAGAVTALQAGDRRVADLTGQRLRLRVPSTAADGVGQQDLAELAGRPDGGVELNLLGLTPRTALTVAAGSGTVAAPVGLRSPELRLVEPGATGQGFTMTVAGGRLAVTDGTAGVDRIALVADGSVGIGLGPAAPRRLLHVEGSEIHSGGGSAGLSFADRTAGGFVEAPDTGQRWVWYAVGGVARLWSGVDRLSVSAGGDLAIGGTNLALAGKHAVRGADAWLRLNQDGAFPSGVHTPGCFAPGSLNVGGVGGWANPGGGNAWIAGSLRVDGGTSVRSLDVAGNVAVNGKHAIQGPDSWLRLNQTGAFASGVHTPGLLFPGSLNVGGMTEGGGVNPGWGNAWITGGLYVQGDVRLAASDHAVYIGGNQTGPFIQFHDDLWFSDPQDGSIELRNADNSGWGRLRGIFLNVSSAAYKRDIAPVAAEHLSTLLSDALQTELVTFRWKGDPDQARLKLGIIAEQAPRYILDDDERSLLMPEYSALLLGAVQALAARVAALERADP